MAAPSEIDIRIRTEDSYEYSLSSSRTLKAADSTESLHFYDESITLYIQNLQKMQVQKTFTSRSCHGSMPIHPQDLQNRKKTGSMNNKNLSQRKQLKLPSIIMNALLGYKKCPNAAKTDLLNRAYGAMLGFFIGDAIGGSLVHKSYSQEKIIQALLMNGNPTFNLNGGEGTDQTEICISTAEGLIQSRGIYDANIMGKKYWEWVESKPFDLPAIMMIPFVEIKKIHKVVGEVNFESIGTDLMRQSYKNRKQQSNLGLIRMIPLIIWSIHLSDFQFIDLIKEQMKLITPNQFVIETCIVYGKLIRIIIKTGDHLLAYHQVSRWIYNFGSQKIIEFWAMIQSNSQIKMTNLTSNNLKFPLLFAINELLEIDQHKKDYKKFFIQSLIKVLSKGFNTDTNCSVALAIVGSVIGYNNIPSYFKHKILNSVTSLTNKKRIKQFCTRNILQIVNDLLKYAPSSLKIKTEHEIVG